jgi:hypothetical protein
VPDVPSVAGRIDRSVVLIKLSLTDLLDFLILFGVKILRDLCQKMHFPLVVGFIVYLEWFAIVVKFVLGSAWLMFLLLLADWLKTCSTAAADPGSLIV